jgi:hypothetical protein
VLTHLSPSVWRPGERQDVSQRDDRDLQPGQIARELYPLDRLHTRDHAPLLRVLTPERPALSSSQLRRAARPRSSPPTTQTRTLGADATAIGERTLSLVVGGLPISAFPGLLSSALTVTLLDALIANNRPRPNSAGTHVWSLRLRGAVCRGFCAFPCWRVCLRRTQSGYRGVNVSLLNRPISSIWQDRRRSQSQGQSRTEKIQSWTKYGIDFTPSHEMWGYAQCAVGMLEPVFTENSEGLVHLKPLQGAFTRRRSSILPIAAD